jgi:transcriptional regulator with XRE-family HTH domain
MEQAMKISPSTVRRLRTERGWSQEQLAIASGLSLRTVQRIEAEGTASMGTAVSLAATYGVQLMELQQVLLPAGDRKAPAAAHTMLLLGLAVVTAAIISESGRLPGLPMSDGFAAMNMLLVIVGTLLVVPALATIFRRRQYIGAALAVVGMPLATLLAGGMILALVSDRVPAWHLVGMGAAGIALVVMALREFRRGNRTAGA